MADNPTIVALKRAKIHLYQILIYKGIHSPISALQIFVFFMVTLKFSARNSQYKFQFVVFSMSALTILCLQWSLTTHPSAGCNTIGLLLSVLKSKVSEVRLFLNIIIYRWRSFLKNALGMKSYSWLFMFRIKKINKITPLFKKSLYIYFEGWYFIFVTCSDNYDASANISTRVGNTVFLYQV